uniref:Helitron helicase-like domain-containing protein n=1 Tax=Lactuca sativa TaxID=4236 RepID=A0A9R1UEF3_LACSA|nr:hypothetical protein LSAT_V11C900505300 [Lactuca sativa]
MKSFNSKKSRKLNSFYLDDRNNINLSISSSRENSTATNVIDSTYNGINDNITALSNISNANISFNNYTTSTLQNKIHYFGLCNGMTSTNASTITVSSSSIKLNPGCHKLKRNLDNLSPIPFFDLTADVKNMHEVITQNQLIGISKEYLDHGDQIVKNESIKGKERGNTNYSLCCGYGKVQLPYAPPAYERMFRGTDSKIKTSMKNIRRYNSMFSFTSMGGKIDSSINRGNAPYIFRLGGQNYHSIGSLLPPSGSQPKFSQLYIYDTDNENSNRQICFGGEKHQSTSIDNDIVENLKVMLDSNNVLVGSYRMVRDTFKKYPHVDMNLRIISRRDPDGRTYNLLTASEVVALIIGDIFYSIDNKDIIVETRLGFLQRISELHPSYLPLQYPLLFPYGDDGYSVDILHRVAYTMIESERLYYIRSQQHVLRCASYENLHQGTTNISNVGQRVILPSSFTGGARYMLQNYLDAMSLCKWFGYPDFFITFMCNTKWPEVVKIKLDAFIKDLRENHIFSIVQVVVYTIEFQKRGLPHSHICLFMHSDYKLPIVEFIDPIISAEIPNIHEDP